MTKAVVLQEKTTDGTETLLPRTSADLVGYSKANSTATNVQEALDEMNDNFQGDAPGVVARVKTVEGEVRNLQTGQTGTEDRLDALETTQGDVRAEIDAARARGQISLYSHSGGANPDLNLFTTPGAYGLVQTGQLNGPGLAAGTLQVYRRADGNIAQLYMEDNHSPARMAFRCLHGGAWSAWRRVVTAEGADALSPADIGAAPSAHKHAAGDVTSGTLPAARGGTGRTDGKAAALATARTIALSGGATGTATAFDGTKNIAVPVTGLDMGKANAGTLPVVRGGTGVTTVDKIKDMVGVPGIVARVDALEAKPNPTPASIGALAVNGTAANSLKWNGAAQYKSAAGPSGGADNDVWLQYL